MFDLRQLERAQEVVGAAMPPTPAHAWPLLAQRLGTEVIVKHENHTPTGAFKVRGGLVYVERLKRERPGTAGLISATRGNHGQSIAFAAHRYGVPVTIYVPHGNSAEKTRAMRAFGADLVEHGDDFQEARGGLSSGRSKRARDGAVVPFRSGHGGRDLRARTPAPGARP
jgi:threonine dehydratase